MVTISCGFGAGCIQKLLFVEELPWPKFLHEYIGGPCAIVSHSV